MTKNYDKDKVTPDEANQIRDMMETQQEAGNPVGNLFNLVEVDEKTEQDQS